jgi:glycosyltransferase involved in cell wall biosynthesis
MDGGRPDQPKGADISLLIPCYNAAEHLPRLIATARAQTLPYQQILCYDDASTDSTADVIRDLGLTLLSGKRNRGAAFARNRLLEAAETEWVHFNDADDEIDPHFCSIMSANLESEEVACVCDLSIRSSQDPGHTATVKYAPVCRAPEPLLLLLNNCIQVNAIVFPRRRLLEIGGFCQSMRFCEDYDVVTRLVHSGVRLVNVDRPFVTEIKRQGSITTLAREGEIARYYCWFLHRAYRKLGRAYWSAIGAIAIHQAWSYYFQGTKASLAKDFMVLSRLCGVQALPGADSIEKSVAKVFGTETTFFLRKTIAALKRGVRTPSKTRSA